MNDSYPYSLLDAISELYKDQKGSYNDVFILACQHLLEPQAKMFELISAFGIPKENIYIFGKIYSTSNEIVNELDRDDFKVSKPIFDPIISFDIQHAKNCKNELKDFLSSIKSPSRIIILDDGGELLKTVNDSFDSMPKNVPVVGIEQTSSGFRKLEHSVLHFPIFNVARSAIKLIKESPLIAEFGCNRIVDVIAQYSISEPRILIVGLGPIGSNVISILADKNYFTVGYDVAYHEQSELIDLIKKDNINIVIGATGQNILSENQLQEIKNILDHDLYLISMSSADREFPASYIRKNGVHSSEIHADTVWDNLVLINNGFPITFKGKRYESTPQEIERTIGLLYGSTLEAMIADMNGIVGFIEVPAKVIEVLENYE